MLVNVKTYLNARIGLPSTSSECVDFRQPGESLDIDSVLIGDEINGNAVWYRNKTDNCFYWSEGISEQSFMLETGNIYTGLSEPDKHVFLRSFIYAFQATPNPGSKILNMGISRLDEGTGLIIEVITGFSDEELGLKNGQLIFKGAAIPFKISSPAIFKQNMYADTSTPFVLGGSISNVETGETGSRGIKVKRGDQRLLLTCFHVACYNLMKNKTSEFDGSAITLQTPSEMAAGSTVATVNTNVSEGVLNMYFDYAATVIEDNFTLNFVPDQGFIRGAYTRADFNKLTLGTTLRTFGCITGHASGEITQINHGSTDIVYDFIGTIPMIETIETQQISVPGDSGAPVFDGEMNLVGLIIANNEASKRSLIMPIHQLFFNKSFSI